MMMTEEIKLKELYNIYQKYEQLMIKQNEFNKNFKKSIEKPSPKMMWQDVFGSSFQENKIIKYTKPNTEEFEVVYDYPETINETQQNNTDELEELKKILRSKINKYNEILDKTQKESEERLKTFAFYERQQRPIGGVVRVNF